VRFDVDQRFAADPDSVLAVYTDPDFYEHLAGLTKIGEPEVLDATRAGDLVTMRVRFRFTAPLPSAALAVIDQQKLTWIDETVYDLAARTSTTRLLPDHYADRLQASASARFTADPGRPDATRRTGHGELKVRMPLVGGKVETVIVTDLRAHLADEALVVVEYLRR